MIASPNRSVWTDPDTPATVLLVLFADLFGVEPDEEGGPLDWSPETKRIDVAAETGVVLSPVALARLDAACEVLTRDTFYTTVPDFIRVCLALNGVPSHPGLAGLAEVDDCAWAVAEAMFLDPPEGPVFSPDVTAYAAAVCRRAGLPHPPEAMTHAFGRPLVDAVASARADFPDDPSLSAAVGGAQAESVEAVDDYVRRMAGGLFDRLGRIRLNRGDPSGLVARVRAAVSPS